jgi:hypothetical protein
MMDEASLARLPVGTEIETPGGMTTAVLAANMFRNGRPGWLINGSDIPVSTGQLGAYGRNWRVRESNRLD